MLEESRSERYSVNIKRANYTTLKIRYVSMRQALELLNIFLINYRSLRKCRKPGGGVKRRYNEEFVLNRERCIWMGKRGGPR